MLYVKNCNKDYFIEKVIKRPTGKPIDFNIYALDGYKDQNEHEVYGYVIALRNKKFDPNNIGFMTKSYI